MNGHLTRKERQALYKRERRQAAAQRLRELRRKIRVETPGWIVAEIGTTQSALRGENEPSLYGMIWEAGRPV